MAGKSKKTVSIADPEAIYLLSNKFMDLYPVCFIINLILDRIYLSLCIPLESGIYP